MKPIVKCRQGGKRRELDHIRPYIPSNISNLAEPFCGGAAVAFDREGIAFLNDTNWHLDQPVSTAGWAIDCFQQIMERLFQGKPERLEQEYYHARQVINSPSCTFLENAIAFLIVRQQCFSGMERYNKRGDFNVPWGRYKTFSCGLNEDHHNFLRAATLTRGSAIDHIRNLPADTFVFLDPPYLDRAGYQEGDGGYDLHSDLAVTLADLDLPWLLVHSDHDFYRHAYRDFYITEVPIRYSQQWKGRDRPDADVKHLYITNVGPNGRFFRLCPFYKTHGSRHPNFS